MLHFDFQKLEQLLVDLSSLLRTSVSVYDNNFDIVSFSTNNVFHNRNEDVRNFLCLSVKSCLKKKCYASDVSAFKKLSAQNDKLSYSCHFGLTEAAFALYSEQTVMGYVIFGPFREEKNDEIVLRNIEALAETYPEKERKRIAENLRQSYYSLEKLDKEKYESFKNIFRSLIEYAKLQNIITLKSDFFTLTVQPFILQNLANDLSRETLCTQFSMSKRQLYQHFYENTGLPPIKYITQLRIAKARDMILTTDTPLSLIPEAVGFMDYNYFIKVFKAVDGHVPSFYKTKQRKKQPIRKK